MDVLKNVETNKINAFKVQGHLKRTGSRLFACNQNAATGGPKLQCRRPGSVEHHIQN